MPVLSDAQLASVARSAGFTGQNLVIAVAVALGESGGNTAATNRNNNGSRDDGLWQINSIHRAIIAGRDLTNPDVNASLAFQISSRGTNWKPWVAYTNGSYRTFMSRAATAAGQPGADYQSIDNPAFASDPTASFSFFTNPGMWARVGVFILGGVLLLVALWQFAGTSVTGVVMPAVRRTVRKAK